MKALLYKELKLAMHPVCYAFIFLFPLMAFIPDGSSYPRSIAFIYILSCYPILFLGANKGQQSNDLLFSTLLPVRKKDIVVARILTVLLMQFVFMILFSCCCVINYFIAQHMLASGDPDIIKTFTPTGLGVNTTVLLLAFAIVGFAFADLIFFPIYYKNGKSIVMSTLFTILGFAIYLVFVSIVLPIIVGAELINSTPVWIQLLALLGSLLISFGVHVLVYKISAKRLEKVDF